MNTNWFASIPKISIFHRSSWTALSTHCRALASSSTVRLVCERSDVEIFFGLRLMDKSSRFVASSMLFVFVRMAYISILNCHYDSYVVVFLISFVFLRQLHISPEAKKSTQNCLIIATCVILSKITLAWPNCCFSPLVISAGVFDTLWLDLRAVSVCF